MARLQSEFCTKDFFLSYEFSYEKCPAILPEIFEPYSVGQKKIPAKFPPNFPPNFPNFHAKSLKKITGELLQERREKKSRLSLIWWVVAVFSSMECPPSSDVRDLICFCALLIPNQPLWPAGREGKISIALLHSSVGLQDQSLGTAGMMRALQLRHPRLRVL